MDLASLQLVGGILKKETIDAIVRESDGVPPPERLQKYEGRAPHARDASEASVDYLNWALGISASALTRGCKATAAIAAKGVPPYSGEVTAANFQRVRRMEALARFVYERAKNPTTLDQIDWYAIYHGFVSFAKGPLTT